MILQTTKIIKGIIINSTSEIICLDLETSGKDPKTAQIVQIAALVLHGRKHTIKEGAEFNCLVKPLYGEECSKAGLQELDDGAIKIHGKTHEILANAITLESALKNFTEFCLEHNFRKTDWTAPIAAGYNINGYDLPILKRDYERTGLKYPLHPVFTIDAMQISWLFFENNSEVKSLSQDNLVRGYMGYKDPEGMAAHDAMGDVKASTEVTRRYLKLIRGVAAKTVFKGALSAE